MNIQGAVVTIAKDFGLKPAALPYDFYRHASPPPIADVQPINIPQHAFSNGPWLDVPLTKRIGLPLKMILQQPQAKEDSKNAYNPYVHQFWIELDPRSAVFGRYLIAPPYSSAVFCRCDGKDLDPRNLIVLNALLTDLVAPYIERFWKEPNKDFTRVALSYLLEPCFVVKYFKNHHAAVAKEGMPMAGISGSETGIQSRETAIQTWGSMECPIGDEEKCQECGRTECEDGKALMKCGKCGYTTYCSRDCQKKEWKLHKVVCEWIKERGLEKESEALKPSLLQNHG